MTDQPHNTGRESRLQKALVSPMTSISDAIPILDGAGTGLLLLAEDDRRLVGILTDGDIRRAILHGVSFDEPCIEICSRNPVTAPPHVTAEETLHLMDHSREFVVNHLPVVDADKRVVDLLLRRDLVSQDGLGVSAVVMAGGYGMRLRPLTEETPKPMLPVAGRPLLELVIEQLRQAGIRHVNLTTHYRKDLVTQHFGDGRDFGVEIQYLEEDQPLGTAGALSMLGSLDEPLLVVNGDILTEMDFRAMLDFHREHKADMTVAVREYKFRIPFGVIEADGVDITNISEKPVVQHFVNAGIYLLDPGCHHSVPNDQRYDMTDLIGKLVEEGRRVISFPIHEYWLDIGRLEDYERAQSDVEDTEGAGGPHGLE